VAKRLIDLDQDLVDEAMAALGESTVAGTVREALRRAVAEAAWNRAMDYVTSLSDEQVAAVEEARNSW
jgi:Arc/MetJ family transcription regulator